MEDSKSEFLSSKITAAIISSAGAIFSYYMIGSDDGFFMNLINYFLFLPVLILTIVLSGYNLYYVFKIGSMDDAEWENYRLNKKTLLSKAVYIHPDTKDEKTVRRGFSIPVFIFGIFVPIFRQQYSLAFKYGIILIIILTFGNIIPIIGPFILDRITCFCLARKYNSLYEKWLKDQGYVIKNVESINKTIERVQKQLS